MQALAYSIFDISVFSFPTPTYLARFFQHNFGRGGLGTKICFQKCIEIRIINMCVKYGSFVDVEDKFGCVQTCFI